MSREVERRMDELEIPFGPFGVDPYGISKKHLTVGFSMAEPIYKHYFSVRAIGASNVPARGRAMLVGNHSGGIAIDGMMVVASMFFAKNPPRLAQGMVEKFMNRMPFASMLTARMGQLTGLPEHAIRLLEDERLLMVFPEGAKGTAKLYKDRYSLVRFGTGFMRLAMRTKSPIIPFAFLGGGAAVPTIYNSVALGRLFGAPYVPITPYGVAMPLPVKLEVEYGEPMMFEGTGAEADPVIEGYVEQVRTRIAEMIEAGRIRRESFAEQTLNQLRGGER
ncbi:MAG TPA: 1-acyl-sn-glycerol-3-phosphate acyltransferase [Polyangiaceae bacterium]|nr:1-acyl-sn-glycerol-3-phosphate acyltransferase [Polyangiaceae bacterium]